MTNTDMRRYDGVIRLVIATAVFLVGCSKDLASDAPQAARPSIRQEEAKSSLSLEAVVVPVTNILTTLIGFRHAAPPPLEGRELPDFPLPEATGARAGGGTGSLERCQYAYGELFRDHSPTEN